VAAPHHLPAAHDSNQFKKLSKTLTARPNRLPASRDFDRDVDPLQDFETDRVVRF